MFGYKKAIEHDSLELSSKPPLNNIDEVRKYPIVPKSAIQIASLLNFLEDAIRDSSTIDDELPRLAHQQQVIYRYLSKDLHLAEKVISLLDDKWHDVAKRHLFARREFLKMAEGKPRPKMMPAWRIVQPEPLEKLLSYYHNAELATGIEWEVLAAINLVETGMGRIKGVSVANAQGPMQFLPTTWQLPGIGMDGDINDPHDSIQAAARYLVRRGGLEDIRKGLWGYNNSDYYGRAVLEYASLMREDPLSFKGLYHWEIHFNVQEGDLWLPVGYSLEQSIPISTYLKQFPVSAPPN